jgi:predicted phage baseplate assembly protein
VDETTGVATFGDGERGLPPPTGAMIFARYRVTRAENGNVLAEKDWSLSGSAHNRALFRSSATAMIERIFNPFAAAGGAEAETIKHAEGRALEEVNRVTRAVTVSDIERLAIGTPGTDIARAAVKPNIDSRYPCLHAPGVITVIILPNFDKPGAQPSRELRAAVRNYLNRRRIVGSRIEVVGPVYTKVTVQARVRSQVGADAARVRGDVVRALGDFFHPLRGGPDRTV